MDKECGICEDVIFFDCEDDYATDENYDYHLDCFDTWQKEEGEFYASLLGVRLKK